jgi:hypothetical protein
LGGVQVGFFAWALVLPFPMIISWYVLQSFLEKLHREGSLALKELGGCPTHEKLNLEEGTK